MSGGVNWSEEDLKDLEFRRAHPNVEKIPPAKARSKAHGSHTAGVMNKTEAAYAQYLDMLKNLPENVQVIRAWHFEQITFRLAKDLRYTPDFMVQTSSGAIQFHEIKHARKGKMFSEDDSKVKVKVAAEMFPYFKFFWVFRNKYGEWQTIGV